MPINWVEVRGWAALVLSYAVALSAVGVFLWRAGVKKLNAVTIAFREERDREMRGLLESTHDTAKSCAAHGQKLNDHERRLIMAEGESKVANATLAEIAVHLARIADGERGVAGRLGGIEASVNMLLIKEGLKK